MLYHELKKAEKVPHIPSPTLLQVLTSAGVNPPEIGLPQPINESLSGKYETLSGPSTPGVTSTLVYCRRLNSLSFCLTIGVG